MEKRLATENIKSLLLSLALPAILGQMITLIYNMVDRIYIGRLEDGALMMAAIGICVPLTTIINAFNSLFGRGGAPLSSISLGRKDYDEANRILTTSFIFLVGISITITLVVILFKDPILYMFGASKNTITYARDYVTIYSLGTIFVQLTVGLNYFINTQGFTKFGMVTTMLGAGLNILLDPLFIFVFDMGIKGAALATIISQAVSCIWVVSFFFGKRSILRIKKEYFIPKWNTLKRILVLGSSPFFMTSTEGLLTISFNQQLLAYGGDLAVSAMTILVSLRQLVMLPIEGVAAGSQPINSYNYGAKNYERVNDTIFLAMKVTCFYSFIMVMLMVLFPNGFVGLFAKDQSLIELSSKMLRVYIFGTCVTGINSTCQQTYTALGEGKKSFFFAFLRKMILLIPLIFILPVILPFKVMAIVLAEPVSDLITTFCNFTYFRKFIKVKLSD